MYPSKIEVCHFCYFSKITKMKTTTAILPGVRRIGYLDCSKLQRRVDLHAICMNVIPVLTDITEVIFFNEPQCKRKTEVDGSKRMETATLEFHCDELLPIHLPLGFVVFDQNDQYWLIGQQEHPHPKLKVELLCGTPDGDTAGFHYEISHTALKSMIKCIASF